MVNKEKEVKRKRGRPRKPIEDKLSKVLTTDKQKAFLRNRLAGMNKRQAAIQAGYTPSTASIMAKRLTDRLSCNRIFIEEAQRQGLTVEAIIEEIKRGMTESMNPRYPSQPDNFNRRGYADMAIKLYGGYAPTKYDIQKESLEAKYKLTPEDIERIEYCTGEKFIDAEIVKEEDEEDKEPNIEDEDEII